MMPARFTIATGVIEQFGTAVENVSQREGGIAEVMKWYATPLALPCAAPAQTASASIVFATGEADAVFLDLISFERV